MMKAARHHLEFIRWEAGAGFPVPVSNARTAKRGARAIALRGRPARGLFHSQLVSREAHGEPGPWPVSRSWHWGVFLTLLVWMVPMVQAQVTNSTVGSQTNLSSRLDYSAFRIISDRNIFNPARSSRSARSGGETPRPAKVDSFTLVGTMAYEKGRFAFFDGSGSEFRKVLKPDGVIAGYKILDIAPGNVKLGRDGRELELRVGTQMRRQEEGEWQQSAQAGSSPGPGRTASSSGSDSSAAGASGSGGEDNEVLKRLLQKREAEENK